jgi:small subunit ribosomal protein S8
MSLSDPIADMLARIKNAQKSLLVYVDIPYSRQKIKILDALKLEGYISNYSINELRFGVKNIHVKLKYSVKGKPAIEVLERVSKPSCRFYSSYSDFKDFFNGMGVYVVSTSSKGVVSDKIAKQCKVGGEIICRVF